MSSRGFMRGRLSPPMLGFYCKTPSTSPPYPTLYWALKGGDCRERGVPKRGAVATQVIATAGTVDEVVISSVLTRQYTSDDLDNFSRKEGLVYVCGRRWRGKGESGGGRGIWLWGDKGHRIKMGDAGKPRYFSIFIFCPGPSESTSASPGSPETYWREISTGRKSKRWGSSLLCADGECTCRRGAQWEENVLGAQLGRSASKQRQGPCLPFSDDSFTTEFCTQRPRGVTACLGALGHSLSHFPPRWPWDRVWPFHISVSSPLKWGW